MKPRLSLALGAMFLALVPSEALATTSFLNANSRPAMATVAGTVRIHAIQDGATSNHLSWKTPYGDWSTIANPSTVPAFYTASSVVAVSPSAAWGCPSLYLVSVQYVDGGGTSVPAQLWQLSYGTYSGGSCAVSSTGTWRALGVPASDFSNAPYTAAAYDPVTGAVFVGLRTATDGHIWSCRLANQTSNCIWEDETSRGTSGAHPASTASPLSIAVQARRAGTTTNDEVEFYSVTSTGHLQRYRYEADDWNATPIPNPSSPAGTHVDTVAIQTVVFSGTTSIVVAGWDNGASGMPGDSLQLVQNTGNDASWPWRRIDLSGSQGIRWSLNNLAWAVSGTSTRLWYSDYAYHLRRCGISPNTGDCVAAFDAGRPGDQGALDSFGGGLTADYNNAYVVGTLNYATYLFGYQSGPSAWDMHLAPRSSGTPMPNTTRMYEYATTESAGRLLATGFGFASNGQGTGVWSSTDDGSTWTGPVFPFQGSAWGDGGDQSIVFDSSSASPQAFIVSGGVGGLQISRQLTATTWTTPIRIPPTTAAGALYRDRPWLAADRARPSVLYLTWSNGGGPNQGEFAYCTGTNNCTGTGSDWCGPYSLPSNSGCTGYNGAPSCQVVQTGDNTVWLSIQDDTYCGSSGNGVGHETVAGRSPRAASPEKSRARRALLCSVGVRCGAPRYACPSDPQLGRKTKGFCCWCAVLPTHAKPG